jgi:hypothetical protein
MRRYLLAWTTLGLLGATLGCHHTSGICDCDYSWGCPCYRNGGAPVIANGLPAPLLVPGPETPAVQKVISQEKMPAAKPEFSKGK